MTFRVNLFVDMKNFPINANDIGPTKRNRSLVIDNAIGAGCLLLGVTKNWIIQLQRFCITLISLSSVTTCGKEGYVKLVETRAFFTRRNAKCSIPK